MESGQPNSGQPSGLESVSGVSRAGPVFRVLEKMYAWMFVAS